MKIFRLMSYRNARIFSLCFTLFVFEHSVEHRHHRRDHCRHCHHYPFDTFVDLIGVRYECIFDNYRS